MQSADVRKFLCAKQYKYLSKREDVIEAGIRYACIHEATDTVVSQWYIRSAK